MSYKEETNGTMATFIEIDPTLEGKITVRNSFDPNAIYTTML